MSYTYLNPKGNFVAFKSSNLFVSVIQAFKFPLYRPSYRKPSDAVGGERNRIYRSVMCLVSGENIRDLVDLYPGRDEVGCRICLQMGKVSVQSPRS